MAGREDRTKKEVEAVDRMEGWLPGVVVVSALVGFSVLAWYAYHAGTQPSKDEDLIVVEAEKTPIKEKPLDPGGMKFPNQDKTIFETFSGGAPLSPKVERVLPAPEEPMPKNADTSGTKTWVNEKLHKNVEAATQIDNQPAPAPAATPAAKPEQIIGDAKPAAVAKAAPMPTPQPSVSAELKPEVPLHPMKEGEVQGFTHVSAAAALEDKKTQEAAQKKLETTPFKAATWEEASKELPIIDDTADKTAAVSPDSADATAAAAAPSAAAPEATPAKAAAVAAENKSAKPKTTPAPTPEPTPSPTPSPTAKAAAKPAAKPAAKNSGVKVQLGAYRSEEEARGEWKKISSKFSDVADYNMLIVKAEVSGKGTFYRLRLSGFDDLADAKSLCATLTAKSQACIPSSE